MSNLHRETTATETAKLVICFSKEEATARNGSRRYTIVAERDEHGAEPEMLTAWIDAGQTPPAPRSVIHALIERSTVTNLDNGRTYKNSDIRMFAEVTE